jgi:hypothetical protein
MFQWSEWMTISRRNGHEAPNVTFRSQLVTSRLDSCV